MNEETTVNPQKSSKALLLSLSILSLILTIIAGTSVYFVVTYSQRVAHLEQRLEKMSQAVTSTANTNNADSKSLPDKLEEFSDPRLVGMRFLYDPKIWTIAKTAQQQAGGDLGVEPAMRLISKDGELVMSYHFRYGIGGAYWLIRKGGYHVVEGKLTRVFNSASKKYYYGLSETAGRKLATLFTDDSQSRGNFLEDCQKQKQGEPQYVEFTDDECNGLNSGDIIGYVESPSFSWSITLKRTTPLGDFNKAWESDEYINSLDTSNVIVEIGYTGTNPSEADAIVKQIVN